MIDILRKSELMKKVASVLLKITSRFFQFSLNANNDNFINFDVLLKSRKISVFPHKNNPLDSTTILDTIYQF